MKVLSVRREPGSTAVLEIEVSKERVERAVAQGLARVSQRARIPGFRPGKAPRAVVERYVGRDALYEEVLDRLLPEAFREAVQVAGIRPISQPQFDHATLEEGKPLRLVARVEVEPEVRLGDYRSLRVPFEEPPPPDEEVEKTLEALRLRYAHLLPKQGSAALGDFVLVKVLDAPEGEHRFAKDKELLLEVGGEETPEELSKALEGRAAGDEVEWAGKESGPVRVQVVEVRVRELPPLDDAFAQTVSDRQTLQELRAELRARLHGQAQARARAEYEERVLVAVVEASEVDLPETLVHAEIHQLLENLESELRRRGLTWERYLQLVGKTGEQVHEEFRPRAEARVRTRLVLDAVARAENLQPSEEELTQAIQNLAQETGQTEEQVRALLEQTGRMEVLRASLRRRRAANFLVTTASEGRVADLERPQEAEGGSV